ncbi:hypothetical protein LF252_19700 [Hymenobacter sp. BT728]|nr:hypothetical protein [Hymenobacter pini]
MAHVCQVAWLHAQLIATNLALPEAEVVLEQLDRQIFAAADQLLTQPSDAHTGSIVHVLRYFYLRLPAPAATAHLEYLLARQTTLTRPWLSAEPHAPRLPLGLDDGLAAKLLVLLHIHKAGVTSQPIQQYVRYGIRLLLGVKREVDFLDQRYSVFPDWLEAGSGKAIFSDEISWPRGDIGQSLLLYEAHQFLQDAELANVAELVGLNTLLRVSMQSTQVTTAQFYQGAAGVAYLYLKLSAISGQPAYQKGYAFWLHRLQHHVHQELATGFYQGCTAQIQHGLTGVGLVLLSAVTAKPLHWDKMLV